MRLHKPGERKRGMQHGFKVVSKFCAGAMQGPYSQTGQGVDLLVGIWTIGHSGLAYA